MDEIFSEDALQCIYEFSQGVARKINILCDHSLLTAFVKDKPRVTREVIEEAIQEIQFQSEEPKHEQIFASA